MIIVKRVLSSLTTVAFAGVLGLASQSVATASPVLWTISGGAFSQGGTFSGTFTFDADTGAGGTLTSWSISVTSGTGFTAFTYNPGDSVWSEGGNCCGGFEVLQFTSNASGAAERFLFLPFDPALTDAGGVSNAILSPGNSSEVTNNFSNERDVSAGIATSGAAVPEPGTLPLVSLTFLLSAVAFRRLRTAARADKIGSNS